MGTSIVAGYNGTDRGWDGGHAVNGRPGYSWYFGRDAVWSAFAILDYGDFEGVKQILDLFVKYQDLNGKIYHELSTSGFVHDEIIREKMRTNNNTKNLSCRFFIDPHLEINKSG